MDDTEKLEFLGEMVAFFEALPDCKSLDRKAVIEFLTSLKNNKTTREMIFPPRG